MYGLAGGSGNHWEPLGTTCVDVFVSHFERFRIRSFPFSENVGISGGNHSGTTGNHLEVIDSEIVRFGLPS